MTNKYLEAEKRLAELLGFTCEFDTERTGNTAPIWRHVRRTPQFVRGEVPVRWSRDWNACGPLMVEHLLPSQALPHGTVQYILDPLILKAPAYDHPDKDTAVRFAIVMAVIAKLEDERPT